MSKKPKQEIRRIPKKGEFVVIDSALKIRGGQYTEVLEIKKASRVSGGYLIKVRGYLNYISINWIQGCIEAKIKWKR